MLKKSELKYSYNDVMIMPAEISEIRHRNECDVRYDDGFLPIFAAPMTSVIGVGNYDFFEENGIHAILPRSVDYKKRREFLFKGKWVAFSLSEFDELFCNKEQLLDCENMKALIDVANGHMKTIYDMVKMAKELYGNKITIMVGNIANPLTYFEAWKSGADYVRVGIGGGSCCITSSNTAVHYPQASLIDEIVKIKESIVYNYGVSEKELPKIIADGGIKNYSDVIKAIALGADYVMIGGLFAPMIESNGKLFCAKNDGRFIEIKREIHLFEENGKIYERCDHDIIPRDNIKKEVYGMASRRGQEDISKIKTKTSEGIVKFVDITTSLKKWCKNMESYLASAMSYTNSKTLKDLSKSDVILVSNNAKLSINK